MLFPNQNGVRRDMTLPSYSDNFSEEKLMATPLLNRILTLPQDVLARISTYGFRNTAEHTICRISEVWHEWRLGIKSCGYVSLFKLGIDNQSCKDYVPIEYLSFHKVMKKLEINSGKDVFLDYGSGMGRAVISAATYPFRKVIGVELSAQLNVLAEENIRRAHTKLKCKNVQVITADAASYLPPDEVTIFFLFNPFDGEILARVFDNIRTSLENAPRHIRVVYQPPAGQHQTMLDNCNWLKKSGQFRGYSYMGYQRVTFVYQNE
jgi:predicted RNA methylase